MDKYIYLIVPFSAALFAQVIKFLTETIVYRKLDWARLFNGNGGMPSTHTSFTTSLAVTIGILEGIDTPIFSLSLILACVVAYDSMGLRMESGKQAVAINNINDELHKKKKVKKLKEQLGHQPIEVLMGIIWSFIWSIIVINLI